MKPRPGRPVAIGVGLVGLALLGGLAVALRDPILEAWHLRDLESTDETVQEDAVVFFARRGSWRVVPHLGRMLARGRLVEATTDALWTIGPQGRSALLAAAEETSWSLRKRILDILRKRRAPVEFQYRVLEAGIEQLGAREWLASRPEFISPLLEGLVDRQASPDVRAGIAAALVDRRLDLTADVVSRLAALASDRADDHAVRASVYSLLDALGEGPDSPRGLLRIPDIVAHPGENVAIEFHADLEWPVEVFVIHFGLPTSVARFVRTGATGTALEEFDPRGLVGSKKGATGSFVTGFAQVAMSKTRFIEPGKDVLLVRAFIEIPADAPPGVYPVTTLPRFTTALAGRSSRLDVGNVGSLRIVDTQVGTPAAPTPTPDVTAGNTEAGSPPVTSPPHGDDSAGDRPARVFRFRAEVVRARPGQKGVRVRIFATSSEASQGFSFGLRITPGLSRIRDLIEGDATTRAEFGSFLFQKHVLARGETAVGALDMSPPLSRLPAGENHHVATLVLDVDDDVPPGTVIPVTIGEFGEPRGSTIFTVGEAESVDASTWPGAVLVGPSPVPEIEVARAVRIPRRLTADEETTDTVRLTWRNPAVYESLEIHRDGERIATLPGDREVLLDKTAGSDVHHYRIVAVRKTATGQKRSFPVEFGIHAR